MATTDPVIIPLVIDGKTIVPTMTELNRELKAARKEQDGFVAGTKEYDAAANKVKVLAEKHKETADATAKSRAEGVKLTETIKGFGPAGQIIGSTAQQAGILKDKFTEGVGSVGKMSGSFGILKTAIAATGIGLLIVAVGSLIAYFKETDTGAKRLEGGLNAVGNVISVLTGYIIKFGQFMLESFLHPLDALKDLSNALLHPVDTFNNLSEGAKKFGNEMVDATKAGFELADAMDAIDEKQRSFNEQNALAEEQVSILILQSKNRTASEKERIAALEKAGKLEEQILNRNIELSAQKVAAIDIEIAQKAKIAGKDEISDELANKRSAAVVEGINLRKQSLDLEEKISNRKDALFQAEDAKRQKEEDAAKKKAEKEVADREKLEKLRANEAEYDAFLLKQKAENEAKQREENLNVIAAEEEAQKLAIEQKFFGQIATQKQKEDELFAVERAANVKRLAEIKGQSTKEVAERNKLNTEIVKADSDKLAKETELEHKTNLLKQNLRNANIDHAKQGLALGIQILNQDQQSRQKYAVAIKALSVSQIAIDLAKTITANNLAAAANPLNAITFGAAGVSQAALTNGLAIATAAFQTGVVLSQKFKRGGIAPRMREAYGLGGAFVGMSGGVASGGAHGSNYGDSGIALIDRSSGREVGEMEGEEPILTAAVSRNPTLRAAASTINVMAGGRSFADGTAGVNSQGGTILGLDSSELVKEFREFKEEIKDWQRNIKVTNSIVDNKKQLDKYEIMIDNSTL